MKKMLMAVACLGMIGSANMFALDLVKVATLVTDVDTLQKQGPKNAKEMGQLITEANKLNDPLSKAVGALKASGPALKITQPALNIIKTLGETKLSPKITKAVGEAVKSLEELNKNLEAMNAIAEVLG